MIDGETIGGSNFIMAGIAFPDLRGFVIFGMDSFLEELLNDFPSELGEGFFTGEGKDCYFIRS
jgi:hypothetical protein